MTVLAVSVLVLGGLTSAMAQRRGSFGGGGGFRGGGFSGGGFSRGFSSSGGSGSFGSRSGGFGSRSTTVPSGSGSFTRSGSGSFSRSGSFGNSGRINSTSISTPRGNFISRSPVYYGGGRYYGYYGGGYGDYWYHPAWYYWMPFHPAFYYNAPYYSDGAYYPGGFSFTRFIVGILIIVFIFWLISRMFRGGGGGGGIKYTMYR